MRFAYSTAVLRGLLSIVFSVALLAAPEQLMPGSSAEPAHTLAVFFCSRLIVLGAAFLALAATRQRRALAVLMFADAGLQVFDLAWPLAHGVTNGFFLPLIIGVAEVAAGLALLKATSSSATRTTTTPDPAAAGS